MPPCSDPLLDCLRVLGLIHGVPVHPAGAVHGLPLVDGRLTPALFCRAALRSGFQTKVVRRPLRKLHEATFPVVVLLRGDQAAILLKRHKDGLLEWARPGHASEPSRVPAAEVEAEYSGYAILVKPLRNFEARAQLEDDGEGLESVHWFWGTLWRFRGFYGRVIVATIVINLLALTSSLFIKNVYDRVVPNQATDTLWVLAVGVVCAYLFEFTLKSLRTFFVDRAGHRIDLTIGASLFARVLGMRFRDRPASAGILAGQARSYEALREFFASATVAALVDLPFVFVFAGIVWMMGGVTAVPLVVGGLLAVFAGAIMQWPISEAVSRGYKASNQRQALFVESVNAMELIKSTGSESDLQARYEECVHVSASAEGKSRAYSQLAMNLTALIQQMVSTAIVVVAYFQVIEENMTMGAMVACVIMAGRAMGPLALVASLLTRLQQSRRSLKGLDEIMKCPLERDERGGRYVGSERIEGRIAVSGVTFAHDPEGEPVLKGVGFQVEPGERVALLGRIGSGKSTMLRLLLSLYTPSGGSITVGGIELRQIDPAEWRRRVGYVPQDPALLYGTLRSWLTAGARYVSDDALWGAIGRAGLASFVRGLPRGLDHPIAEGGRNLSGGQRQALCLARALVTEPSILILDEPTSAIDQTTERQVLRELDAYLKEDPTRTLIVATHRRSVLQLVSRIVALDGGKVIADGPRDSVLKGQAPAVVDRSVCLTKPSKPEDSDLALAPTYCPEMTVIDPKR